MKNSTVRNIRFVADHSAQSQKQHNNDVIMTTMASQFTSLTVVYSPFYSDADQRIHQSSASLAFVWGIHRDRWIPRTKGQLRGKCFHLMTSSWNYRTPHWGQHGIFSWYTQGESINLVLIAGGTVAIGIENDCIVRQIHKPFPCL